MNTDNIDKLKLFKERLSGESNGNKLKSKLVEQEKMKAYADSISVDGLSVSLKLYNPTFSYCFSDLTKSELKKFSEFCVTVQGLKSPEEFIGTEFNCTTDANRDIISKEYAKILEQVGISSEQSEMNHYKLSGRARIHGIWSISGRFKLIWIDPEHELHSKK